MSATEPQRGPVSASPGQSPASPGQSPARTEGAEVPRGLPMFSAADPEALAREKQELAALAARPFLARWLGYTRRTGPGWIQSAMTLGGGSAIASLTLGAFFGYDMLWLQPLAMVLGIVMLAAMSHQTLSTGARPFGAMKQYVTPAAGWAWAGATLVATVIWHFPQYALAAGMTEDMLTAATGWEPAGRTRTLALLAIGLVYLALSVAIVWSYGRGRRGVRLYERALKLMVWMIILAFAAVVVRGTMAGRIEWGRVLKGFVPLRLPTDAKGIELLMAAFGAAVGINMTFLFPYTLLARGWGKEHRGLSRFDLVTGMFLPFVLAVSLMTVAAGATIHGSRAFTGNIRPVEAAGMMAQAGVGDFFGHFIFGLGILGMVLSSIMTHMLVCGFAACEVFGADPKGWKYRLACLIPVPGVLGVVLWEKMGSWIAVRTSAIAGVLLPIAYVSFFVLHNRRRYLGADTPAGWKRWAWNLAMLAAIAATVASITYFLMHNYDRVLGEHLTGRLRAWLSGAGG